MEKSTISIKTVLIGFFLWLIITQSFSWLAFNRLQITEPDKKDCSSKIGCQRFDPHPLDFLEMHARQDTAWYFNIAYEGYKFSKKEQSNVNFFPLYPILMKYGNDVLRPLTPNLTLYHRYLLSGLLISFLSVFLAVIILFKLFRLDNDSRISFLAISLLLIFPTSYFFTAVYTESLFLLLSVSTFYFARRGQFVFSSLVGYFASLTKPMGIFLIIPVAIELFIRSKQNKNNLILNSISLAFIPLGLITFMYYLNQKFGNPFLFIDAAQKWGRNLTLSVAFPLDVIYSLFRYVERELNFNHASAANISLELLFFVLGLVISIMVLKKERLSYGIWCLVSVLFPITSGVLVSQGRYTLVIFPIFLTLSRLVRKSFLFGHFYTLVSVLLLGLLTILFVNGYWSF